jgi:hypothetical protein
MKKEQFQLGKVYWVDICSYYNKELKPNKVSGIMGSSLKKYRSFVGIVKPVHFFYDTTVAIKVCGYHNNDRYFAINLPIIPIRILREVNEGKCFDEVKKINV